MALSSREEIRVAALNAAVAHVHEEGPGFESGLRVVAFAEHFEHYIRTGENKGAEDNGARV